MPRWAGGDEMPYEIFVSYSRRAVRLCDQVVEILQTRLGYDGAVFVDREGIPGGTQWQKQIDDALSESEYLVLLATKEAVRDPDNVLAEIRKARQRNIEIIPIEFDRGTGTPTWHVRGRLPTYYATKWRSYSRWLSRRWEDDRLSR